MVTKDDHKIFICTTLLFWFALMFAPALFAEDAWHEVDHPTLDFMYVNSDIAAKAYGNVVLDNVSVWYANESTWGETAAKDLRLATENLLRASIVTNNLNLVANSDSDAIVLRFQLIDLRAESADKSAPPWAKNYRFRVMPGRVTMVAELFDAATGKVLVRMADLQDAQQEDVLQELNVDLAVVRWGDVIAASIHSLPSSLQMAALRAN